MNKSMVEYKTPTTNVIQNLHKHWSEREGEKTQNSRSHVKSKHMNIAKQDLHVTN